VPAENYGSWLAIHERTCHGLRSSPVQTRLTWLAEIPTSSASAWDTASMVQRDAGSGGVCRSSDDPEAVVMSVDERAGPGEDGLSARRVPGLGCACATYPRSACRC